MVEILPSVRFEADDPKPVGFVNEVDEAHLDAVGNALRGIAKAVASASEGHEAALRVRFCSVRYTPTLPFVLYSFHIACIGDNGDFIDETDEGGEISYALVANHAVEVQREAALLFLYELLFRREALRQALDPSEGREGEADAVVAIADDKARREFRDRIHRGWRLAATSIAQRAAATGLPLHVRYEVDALPTRDDVVRRIPRLRLAYNDVDIAREAIDKQVSMIGGSDPRISAPGLMQADEDALQRLMASLGMRQWVSQTTRDAEVCGNGYLVTAAGPEPYLYALRPEEVEILAPGSYAVSRGGSKELVRGHVVHLRGIEQFESPYGISYLEPILDEYRRRHILERVAHGANYVLGVRPPNSEEGSWAQQMVDMTERSLAESNKRLDDLLQYPRKWMRDARKGLYFPGQERM